MRNRLWQSFLCPPDSIKVGCYYYWVNEHVDPKGVKADLQYMKDNGITLAYLATDIRNRTRWDNPWEGQVFGKNKFQSRLWWKNLRTALKTAGELGIEMGLFNCPGWSQSGGPWVKPDEAMRNWTPQGIEVCQDARGNRVVNGPCSPEAQGLEVDKLSKTLVKKHFEAFFGEILRRIPQKDRPTLTTVVVDSWERGKQNYTDSIFVKFKQRFGYELDYTNETCKKELDRLIAELVTSEYMGGLTEKAHEYGLRTWCEPYAHSPFPGNSITYGSAADEVAAEFWVNDRKFRQKEVDAALGAARSSGKNRVWAESFTDGSWTKPAQDDWSFEKLKTIADRYFHAGINASILHVMISQPGDSSKPAVRPWFGTFFDRRSQHAADLKPLVTYLRRCNFMLQLGKPSADAPDCRILPDGVTIRFTDESLFEVTFPDGHRETWNPTIGLQGQDFLITQGSKLSIACDTMGLEPVVKSALRMFAEDCKAVLGADVHLGAEETVILQLADGKKEGFRLEVNGGKLYITGSDGHGLAYGLLEVSRLMGVSPWEWWADAMPKRQAEFVLPDGFVYEQTPSVEYRGIFINDEDWGLMPWASMANGPWYGKGKIRPETNERIFQLLLRLRANTYWPAMHECTEPFFLTPGNREMAERYGIYIGSSHCEPMACNAAGEWSRRGKGDYDYVNNSEQVLRFWEDRVRSVASQPILYTIGMRGVHDGAMQGAKTTEERKAVIERVFKDQRGLLEKYVCPDATKVPQVFIPYKEVLDIYKAGLQVPEDVCLMWCDDNYGYITHYPTTEERQRKGGNGIYYHVSYWGRPHDYLWLGTFSPALLYQQMTTAYDQGIQKMWILNVGDIKPAEYQIELFMDMAWDMQSVRQSGWTQHLTQFLCREFGGELSGQLLPVMQEHYRLAHIRKPEFMGGTRTEEGDHKYWNTIRDLPWSNAYIAQRLSEYQQIEDEAEQLFTQVKPNRKDEYFQLVKYPVQAAAEMNKKLLYAQQARHGFCPWTKSDAAYDSIQVLTRIYNTGIRNEGKWHRMMDSHPRRLPVFEPVDHINVSSPMVEVPQYIAHWNGADCKSGDYTPCEGLGYEGKAVEIAKGKCIVFELNDCPADSIEVEVRLLPVHPIEGDAIRFQLSFDGRQSPVTDYATHGRSEEWKENVINNQTIRRFRFIQ